MIMMQVNKIAWQTGYSCSLAVSSLQDRTHTLKSFASSADWVKSLHFGDPKPTADPGIAAERSSKRRKLGTYTGPEPTIDEIEGEFWRVIEAPDDVRNSFLDSR